MSEQEVQAAPAALPSEPPSPKPPRSLAAGIARSFMLLMATLLVVSVGLLGLRWARGRVLPAAVPAQVEIPADPQTLQTAVAALEKDVRKLAVANQKLKARLATLKPRGTYLVIDAGANRVRLMKDDQVIREGICSTGSGVRLLDPSQPRSWVFDTPRGEFTIQRKINEPVWTKPDWAFVEAGENLPSDWSERVEEGVLGDFALDLGQGYLIHGTLFERALGLHVTHGCVRLGAKDLEAIFKTVSIGTKVYII
jgi:L,D-transpeptidase YbiS